MTSIRSLVFLGLLPLISAPAMAGEWQLWFKGAGNHLFTGLNGNDNSWEGDGSVNSYNDGYGGMATLEAEPNQTIYHALIGQAQAALIWVPNGEEAPPAGKVSLLTTAQTWIEWDKSVLTEQNITYVLEGASAPLTGYQLRGYDGRLYQFSTKVGAPRLITVDTSNTYMNEDGELCVDLPAHDFNVSFSMNNSTTQRVSGDTGFYYRASIDTRSVKLTRNSQDRFEIEDGANVTHGDTIYSYNEEHLEADDDGEKKLVTTPKPNSVTFSPLFSGSWSHVLYPYTNPPSMPPGQPAVPKLGWQWSPSSDDDLQNSHSQEMPYGNFVYNSDVNQWMGSPTGRSEKVISYEATDLLDVYTGQATQVKARATYHLTLHDPEEWNPVPTHTFPAVWDVYPATEIVKDNVGVGDSIEGKFQFKDFYFSPTKEAAKAALAAGATVAGQTVGFLFAQAVTLGLNTLAPDPSVQKGAQFEAAWQFYDEDKQADPNFTANSSALCTWEGGRPLAQDGGWDNTTERMEGYTFCNPQLAVESISYTYEGTAWGKDGKVGDLQEGLSKATGKQHVVGNFKLGAPITPPTPGPAPLKVAPPQPKSAIDASTTPSLPETDEAPTTDSTRLPSGGLS